MNDQEKKERLEYYKLRLQDRWSATTLQMLNDKIKQLESELASLDNWQPDLTKPIKLKHVH